MSIDDNEEEEQSDLEQQDSIFSRLEELRFNLEKAMGLEQFIQAYNKIKVRMLRSTDILRIFKCK